MSSSLRRGKSYPFCRVLLRPNKSLSTTWHSSVFSKCWLLLSESLATQELVRRNPGFPRCPPSFLSSLPHGPATPCLRWPYCHPSQLQRGMPSQEYSHSISSLFDFSTKNHCFSFHPLGVLFSVWVGKPDLIIPGINFIGLFVEQQVHGRYFIPTIVLQGKYSFHFVDRYDVSCGETGIWTFSAKSNIEWLPANKVTQL